MIQEDSYEHRILKLEVGSSCCESDAESLDKTQLTVHNVALGYAWSIDAVARWLHSTRLIARFLLLSIAQRPLPRALSLLQVTLDATESLEGTLARLVAASKDDWSARSRLKLLKVCQALCPVSSSTDMALYMASVARLDRVLYTILGYGEDKPRATLFDLATASQSPICQALSDLCYMLEHWGGDVEEWEVLALVGGNFNDPDLKVKSRRELLQLSSGLSEQFEFRLSNPPMSVSTCLTRKSQTLTSTVSWTLTCKNQQIVLRHLQNDFENAAMTTNQCCCG